MVGLVYWNFHQHFKKRSFAIAPLFGFAKSLYEERYRAWILPTFDFGKEPEGYHFRLHPIFYLGKSGDKNHMVFAPVFWHFENKKDKNTVFFPLWWQFRDKQHNRVNRVAFPFWWSFNDKKYGRINRVAFPLWWDFNNTKQMERTSLLIPFFWRVRDRHSSSTGIFNIGLHKGEIKGNPFWTFRIFPLLSFGKPPAPKGARWDFLYGLAGWRRQGSTAELKLFWIPIPIHLKSRDQSQISE
jgi:hypothetical protein